VAKLLLDMARGKGSVLSVKAAQKGLSTTLCFGITIGSVLLVVGLYLAYAYLYEKFPFEQKMKKLGEGAPYEGALAQVGGGTNLFPERSGLKNSASVGGRPSHLGNQEGKEKQEYADHGSNVFKNASSEAANRFLSEEAVLDLGGANFLTTGVPYGLVTPRPKYQNYSIRPNPRPPARDSILGQTALSSAMFSDWSFGGDVDATQQLNSLG
jgi:hypothetical protein